MEIQNTIFIVASFNSTSKIWGASASNACTPQAVCASKTIHKFYHRKDPQEVVIVSDTLGPCFEASDTDTYDKSLLFALIKQPSSTIVVLFEC